MSRPTIASSVLLLTAALFAAGLARPAVGGCGEPIQRPGVRQEGGIPALPPPRPARQARETSTERHELLRRHTLDRALERIARQEEEAPYRYIATPRPARVSGGVR